MDKSSLSRHLFGGRLFDHWLTLGLRRLVDVGVSGLLCLGRVNQLNVVDLSHAVISVVSLQFVHQILKGERVELTWLWDGFGDDWASSDWLAQLLALGSIPRYLLLLNSLWAGTYIGGEAWDNFINNLRGSLLFFGSVFADVHRLEWAILGRGLRSEWVFSVEVALLRLDRYALIPWVTHLFLISDWVYLLDRFL